MTEHQENLIIIRGIVFTVGVAVASFGLGANGITIIGLSMVACTMPGIINIWR
jgi:hypothetical protein